MTEWSVLIETERARTAPSDDVELAAAFASPDLERAGAAIAIGVDTVSIRLAVEADSPDAAFARAVRLIKAARRTQDVIGTSIHIEVTEWNRFVADVAEPNFPELAGVTEVAELLGVSRQRAHALTKRPDFPQPIERLSSGPVWTVVSLRNFVATWDRKPGRPATATSTSAVTPTAIDWSKFTAAGAGATVPPLGLLAVLVAIGALEWRDRRKTALKLGAVPGDAPDTYAKVISLAERIARRNDGKIPIDTIAHELGVDVPAGELRKQFHHYLDAAGE